MSGLRSSAMPRGAALRDFASRSHQVVVLAAFTGAITGLFVAAFDRLVIDVGLDRVVELRPWLIAFMPGVGLLVALARGARSIPLRGPPPRTSTSMRSTTLGTRSCGGRSPRESSRRWPRSDPATRWDSRAHRCTPVPPSAIAFNTTSRGCSVPRTGRCSSSPALRQASRRSSRHLPRVLCSRWRCRTRTTWPAACCFRRSSPVDRAI